MSASKKNPRYSGEVVQIGDSDGFYMQLIRQSPVKTADAVPRLHFRLMDSSTGKEHFFFGFRDGFEKLENLAALSRIFNEYLLARLEVLKREAGYDE